MPIRLMWLMGYLFGARFIVRIYPLIAQPFVFYLISYALFRALYPIFYWPDFGDISKASFPSISMGTALFFLTTTVPALMQPKYVLRCMGVLALLTSAFFLIAWGAGVQYPTVFLSNTSHDASFMAAMLPLMAGVFKMPLIVCVLGSRSATANSMLAAYILMRGLRESKGKYFKAKVLGGAGILISLGFIFKDKFMTGTGRYTEWLKFWKFFVDHKNIWLFGTGPGTGFYYGPALQLESSLRNNVPITEDVFVFFHNEYLQGLFELGIVGLVLGLVVYGRALWGSRGRVQESLILFSIMGFTQFSLHMPLPALAFSALLVLGLRDNQEYQSSSLKSSVTNFPST